MSKKFWAKFCLRVIRADRREEAKKIATEYVQMINRAIYEYNQARRDKPDEQIEDWLDLDYVIEFGEDMDRILDFEREVLRARKEVPIY